jgi:hypothetical protein
LFWLVCAPDCGLFSAWEILLERQRPPHFDGLLRLRGHFRQLLFARKAELNLAARCLPSFPLVQKRICDMR